MLPRQAILSLSLGISSHLTEDGIHTWFRTLKRHVNYEEWNLIADLSFHDLWHDFEGEDS